MKYNFNEIEAKWQKYWKDNETFKAINPNKNTPSSGGGQGEAPKYYVLDMFPYPSGAGLHVGHPLGYIASDIYARYKRHQGFNVLHPMGYDSFGLPAEQYAIQTGQHPAITTKTNINRYREQMDKIGFSFDWSREVRTSNPDYYKWTQWIFIELFNSWYNIDSDKAEDISILVTKFETEGNEYVNAVCDEDVEAFTAEQWNDFSSEEQQKILLKYRLTFLAETEVNWCPELGTVLANDEIVNGVSERGGHPVVRKKMTQWSMRISAYAQRLIDGLSKIDWPQPLKDSQTNWIGRSEGASVEFKIQNSEFRIGVFTTRPDTIFGVTFMTLAPELELVQQITTTEQKAEVDAYIEATAKRSERDRMADVKTISGAFTGAYATHPFTGEEIPIWIGDYVLAGYGTGAVMAVPCGDQRDYDFAKHFNIPIKNIFEGVDISEEAFAEKGATKLMNSDFLNGFSYKEATRKIIDALEEKEAGKGKINYRLRDAVFSRQRYWGEPFPVYYVNGLPQMIDAKHLPIALPEVEKYLPTETGEPPLGNAKKWYWLEKAGVGRIVSKEEFENTSPLGRTGGALELNTMPGWAGSSWYFNRYMDSDNTEEFASQDALNYWKDVDLYIGGSEHATGHLLYSRFWQKFLFDKRIVPVDEFAKKLINQGMILGMSAFVYLVRKNGKKYIISKNKYFEIIEKLTINQNDSNYVDPEGFNWDNVLELLSNGEMVVESYQRIHVPVKYVNASNELDIDGLRNDSEFGKEYNDAIFIGENGEVINTSPLGRTGGAYIVGREVEKMSKSKYNVVNPDDICEQYGADTLRLYEMFLGPLEQAKPWNTAGITGVNSFLKKLWRLYFDDSGCIVTDTPLSGESEGALKTLHKTIKKVIEDINNFSFNTSVSSFMIAVNELIAQKCHSKAILEPLAIIISPYAPHIAEELWQALGHDTSISNASFPQFEEKHLIESSKEYPVSFNGKMRFKKELPLDMSKDEIEKIILADERTQQQLQGREPKKVIVVPGKIINIVG